MKPVKPSASTPSPLGASKPSSPLTQARTSEPSPASGHGSPQPGTTPPGMGWGTTYTPRELKALYGPMSGGLPNCDRFDRTKVRENKG